MSRLFKIIAVCALATTFACNKNDPNKDLKPIDPNTTPPKPAVEVKGGSGGDRPAPVIK